jgi:hypothetical protein
LTRRRFCFLREAVLTAFSEHASRGEAVTGDDVDAIAVHLGEQNLSRRIDETDVRKLDANRDSSRRVSDAPPDTAELPDPFVFERSLQAQRPSGAAVR